MTLERFCYKCVTILFTVEMSTSPLHCFIYSSLEIYSGKKYPVVPAPTRARVCCSEELSVLASVAHVTTKDHTDIWGLGHNL